MGDGTTGDPVNIKLVYDQVTGTLTEFLTDTVNNATFTNITATGDLTSLVGDTQAFLGISGATGGLNSIQTITNFSFAPSTDTNYTNNVVLTGGASATIDLSTAGPPNVNMGTLTVGNGAGTTLNVTGANAPVNQPFTLTLGATTLSGNVRFNVVNNTNGGGNGTGMLSLGAISDGNAGFGITLTGGGVVLLRSSNTYTGPTVITSGTLKLADGSSNNIAASPLITIGAAGTLDVNGLSGGTLLLGAGSQAQTLQGSGIIAGNLTVASGSTVAGASGSTLMIGNNLSLQNGSRSSFALAAPNGSGNASTALIDVLGGLTVTGTNTVNLSGTAQIGTYELYAFNGTAPTTNQFSLGTLPPGSFQYAVNVAGSEVDLLVTAPLGSAAWNFNGNGNYSDLSKWLPNQIPNGATFAATFGNGANVAVNFPDVTVTVDATETAGSLTFSNTNGTHYVLGNDGVAGHGLTLNNQGAGATVNVTAGNPWIFSNLTMADNTTFNIASGSSLLLSIGNLGESGGSRTVTKIGGGTLTIDTPSTYTGATTVNSGTLTTTVTGTIANSPLAINGASANSTVNLNNNQAVTSLSGAVSGGGSAQLNVGAGTMLTVNQSSGTATFAGTLALAASGSLTKQGSGTEILTAVPSLGNNASLAISGGTLKFNTATGTPTIGAGVTASVTSTGTLELAGTASALGTTAVAARVNITNTSTASAGVLVSGGNQQVGGIDGTGVVQVNSGARLTANHVIAGALVIGGTSGNAATVIINPSNATGSPTSESSGLAVAGALVPSEPFGAGAASSTGLLAAATSSSDGLSSAGGASTGASAGGAAAVPEPTTLLLAGVAGLFGLVAAFRGRSQRVG